MGVHEWRKRQSGSFGEVWVPYVQIDLLGADQKFHSVVLQIDSGAVTTVLKRSAAELLGITLGTGHRHELTGVGGATTVFYVHSVHTKFAENIAFQIPIAFAQDENVPNLLGRLRVFDQLQICFDATLTQTEIRPPWESQAGAQNWKFLNETEGHILSRFHELEITDNCKKVIRSFIHRGAQIMASGWAMKQKHLTYAGPALVRALYELSLQFEFLVRDAEKRALDYADFLHITKHEVVQGIVKAPGNLIGMHLAQSDLRAQGEARNIREYQRVRSRFVNKKGKTWSKWYGMSAYDLADKLGRAAEYRLIYSLTSSWSHGDPFSTIGIHMDFFADPKLFWWVIQGYYARILLTFADAFKILLTHEQFEVLKQLAKEKS